jgi:aspartyl protease family protein
MKSRQAVMAEAAQRRYLQFGGGLVVMAVVYAAMTSSGRDAPAMKRVAGQMDRHGHCYVDAIVNGSAPITMLLDTGAEFPLFHSEHLARLGVRASALRYEKPVSTAIGGGYVAPLVLREVRLGDYVVHDVAAAVTKTAGDPGNHQPLLGMSALKSMHIQIGNGACALLWQ